MRALGTLAVLLVACGGGRPPHAQPSDDELDINALTVGTFRAELERRTEKAQQLIALGVLGESRKPACRVEIDRCTGPRKVVAPPQAAMDDDCAYRELVLWAIAELSSETLATEFADRITDLAAIPHEREVAEAVLAKVDEPELLLRIVMRAELAGHGAVLAPAIDRLPQHLVEEAARDGVDAAYRRLLRKPTTREEERTVQRWLYRLALRNDIEFETRVAVFETLGAEAVALGAELVLKPQNDCDRLVKARELSAKHGVTLRSPRTRDWALMACFALRSEGPKSPAIRALVAPDLRVVEYVDHPNDDSLDRHASFTIPNTPQFEMPFAQELIEALRKCHAVTCGVPRRKVVFHLRLDASEQWLEEIERRETIGGWCPD